MNYLRREVWVVGIYVTPCASERIPTTPNADRRRNRCLSCILVFACLSDAALRLCMGVLKIRRFYMYTYRGLEEWNGTAFNLVVNSPCIVDVNLNSSGQRSWSYCHFLEFRAIAEPCPAAVGFHFPAKSWLPATVPLLHSIVAICAI